MSTERIVAIFLLYYLSSVFLGLVLIRTVSMRENRFKTNFNTPPEPEMFTQQCADTDMGAWVLFPFLSILFIVVSTLKYVSVNVGNPFKAMAKLADGVVKCCMK